MQQDNRKSLKKRQTTANNVALAAEEVGNRPPQAPDVEDAVLGAMLLDQDCVSDGMEVLTERSFYDPKNKLIFEAVASLYRDKEAADLLTVPERLRRDGSLESVGGAVRLASLTQKVGSAANFQYYVKILQQKTIQRDLIEAAYGILKDAFDEGTNVDDLIESSQSSVFEAVQGNLKGDYLHVSSVLEKSMKRIESVQNSHGITGIPSGFESLDGITMGWQQSNLVIIGARPSMGKTALALNFARNAAVRFKVPTAFFSLEMSNMELTDRLLSTESGIESDKLKGLKPLSREEWERLEIAVKALDKAPLYIDETPGITTTEFSSKAKRLFREKGVRLIFVDYVGLMHGPSSQQAGSREQEVAAISQALKAVAKELHITVIALSQLNRNLAGRQSSNGRPILSDLRDSGSIEQDADMVLFVHRPGMLGIVEDKTEAELIIAKNRNGRTESLPLTYHGERFQFEDRNDSLVNFAKEIDSRMNAESKDKKEPPTQNDAPYNPFRDFGSYAGVEFEQ